MTEFSGPYVVRDRKGRYKEHRLAWTEHLKRAHRFSSLQEAYRAAVAALDDECLHARVVVLKPKKYDNVVWMHEAPVFVHKPTGIFVQYVNDRVRVNHQNTTYTLKVARIVVRDLLEQHGLRVRLSDCLPLTDPTE